MPPTARAANGAWIHPLSQSIARSGYANDVGTFINVDFTGTHSSGSSPAVTTVGNIIFSPSSTLIMEIGGLSPGAEHDQIVSSGQIVFDGTMQVELINGFSPALGHQFNLFDWVNASGSFDTINLPALSASLAWDISQLYIGGTLSVASARLDGDFNHDDAVDAADYVAWRKPGTDGQQGYDDWRTHFGKSAGIGSSLGGTPFHAVPELGASVLLAAFPLSIQRRRRCHCQKEHQ